MESMCQKYEISVDDGFEIAFNESCNQINLGNYEAAIELLEVAFRAGNPNSIKLGLNVFQGQEALLLENLSPEEVEVELLPVNIQMNYVRGLKETTPELVKELADAFGRTGIGTSIKCVIENNLLAARSLKFSDHPPKRFLYESATKLDKMISEVSGVLDRRFQTL